MNATRASDAAPATSAPAKSGAAEAEYLSEARGGTEPVRGEPALDAYAALLTDIVSVDGLVRYDRFSEPAVAERLREVIDAFAAAEVPAAPAAAMAFLLNAYNANVIALAAEKRGDEGFTTVQAVPGFFDALTVQVAGRNMTLNALEDELRAHQDPRVQGALVRGARGAPPLRAEPYRAAALDQQLNQQCLAWFDDQSRNRTVRTGLVLSEIFRWREADFDVPPYQGVRGFAFKCARRNGAIRDFIRNVPDVTIMYMPFDWSLNAAPIDGENARPEEIG